MGSHGKVPPLCTGGQRPFVTCAAALEFLRIEKERKKTVMRPLTLVRLNLQGMSGARRGSYTRPTVSIALYNLFREQEPPFKSRCRVVRRIHVCVVLGAAFWMDPGNGPSGTVVVAQLTLAKVSGAERTATLGVQGRSGPKEEDWRQDAVTWSLP